MLERICSQDGEEREEMTFADTIRKINFDKRAPLLSVLEAKGDPQALALSFSEIKVEKYTETVGPPRASAIYDDCMRMRVISHEFDLSRERWSSFRESLLFGIGNAVHDWAQNKPFLFGDRRFGWWKCLACGRVRYFGGVPKKSCEHCYAKVEATVYHEHRMMIRKPLIVSGHTDMFFRPMHVKKVRVAEVKTMSGDEFDKLSAPLTNHEWQVQTYMWGCSIDETLPVPVDPNVGYIIYVTKRGREKEFPLKIFPILHNDNLLRRIKTKLKEYKDGITDYPKHIPILHHDCERHKFENWKAKSCPALKECKVQWQGK